LTVLPIWSVFITDKLGTTQRANKKPWPQKYGHGSRDLIKTLGKCYRFRPFLSPPRDSPERFVVAPEEGSEGLGNDFIAALAPPPLFPNVRDAAAGLLGLNEEAAPGEKEGRFPPERKFAAGLEPPDFELRV
jgi:hypothetical protein